MRDVVDLDRADEDLGSAVAVADDDLVGDLHEAHDDLVEVAGLVQDRLAVRAQVEPRQVVVPVVPHAGQQLPAAVCWRVHREDYL